jgi:hypothetical protein
MQSPREAIASPFVLLPRDGFVYLIEFHLWMDECISDVERGNCRLIGLNVLIEHQSNARKYDFAFLGKGKLSFQDIPVLYLQLTRNVDECFQPRST